MAFSSAIAYAGESASIQESLTQAAYEQALINSESLKESLDTASLSPTVVTEKAEKTKLNASPPGDTVNSRDVALSAEALTKASKASAQSNSPKSYRCYTINT